jgi:hypothetical protein
LKAQNEEERGRWISRYKRLSARTNFQAIPS